MKTNIINKLAAMLTVSGLLTITAPLTVTAQNLYVNGTAHPAESDASYEAASTYAALQVFGTSVAGTNGSYSGANITLSATFTANNGRFAVLVDRQGSVTLTGGTIATTNNHFAVNITGASTVALDGITVNTNGYGLVASNSSTITAVNSSIIGQVRGIETADSVFTGSNLIIYGNEVAAVVNGGTSTIHNSEIASSIGQAMSVARDGLATINSSTVGTGFLNTVVFQTGGNLVVNDSLITNTSGSNGSVFRFYGTGTWTPETLTVNGGTITSDGGTLINGNSSPNASAVITLNNVDTSGAGGISATHTSGTIDVTVNGGSGIVGDVSNSGSGTLNISFNNSGWTGCGTVSSDGALTVSLDNDSAWNLTAQSSLTTLNNSGTIIIASALGEDLTVSGVFVQDADGTLDLTISGTGPIINAGTASLGGTLKVSGFSGTAAAKASEIVAKNFTVIHTADGIGGEFSTADFGLAASTVDYVTLSAGLTNSGRDYTLNFGLSWFAASSTSHGNFTINSGNTFEIDVVLSDTAAGQGAGGWDGKTLTKLGDGTLIISSSNDFTGGANIDSGTLRLSNLAGLGTGTVNVAQTILSVLDLSGSGEYKNDTTGQGAIILSANGVNISGNNSTFAGAWDVTGSGTMTSQQNLGAAGVTAVNIAQNGSLSLILGNGDYHFDQPLTGSGYLLLQNTGNISLVPSVPLVAFVPSFTGTVALERNTLALTAANALPLTLATLVTGTNNLVVVDSDPLATSRNIGGLSFSGGTIRFEGYDPHATRADTIIALSGTLSLSGGGTVEVVMPNPSQIPDGSKFTHIPLLQQDDGLALTLLISASGGVTGSPAALALRDDNGRIVSDSYTLNLSHDGVTTDAIGTYDYLLSTGSANDGLYVAFGLKQVDIQTGRTLILDQDTTTPAEGDDFTATIIGSGNLQINATNAITLNGTGNAYSGTTIVNTGTLLVGINEQMFASSTAFVINSGAALNTGGFDQQVNNLTGSGLATFTNNTLTVNNSASTSFSGTLSGGALVKDGTGQLNASDATAHLSQVQIDNGSLLLGNNATVSASGQPAVLANGGTATFNASALSTSGSVLILAKDNSPATVNLNNMTVSVAGNFVEANNGALTVTLNDSTATGKTAVVGGGALNLGLNHSVWNLTGKSKLTTLTSSGGTITIDNVQGEDLTVSNGIIGQTALNLTLSDSVKGQQEIWVVVDETNNMSNSAFTLSHEVSYGMYNYNLVNANDGVWLVYTGSSGTIPPVNPPGPDTPPTISNEGDTIINTAAAVAGFWFTQLDNLHKRMGELRYNKPANADALDNIWVRAYGQQINANTGIYSVKGFAETQYGVDLGTDYLWKLDADNQLYTGVFAGYGGADRDFHTNYSGNTDSGYGGVYATWLNKDGWYADVVAKGQYFRNDFTGADHAEYDSLGAGISLEVGNMFEFKDGWFAEPSVQFSYLHLMNDNYTTRDNLHVILTDADVLHIYGGARFGRNIKLTNSGMLQPYIKAGGLGQISSGNKLTVSGDHWRPNLDGARAVVGAGLIWQLDADSQLHLDYEASFGEKYDKPWGVNFGYRYQF